MWRLKSIHRLGEFIRKKPFTTRVCNRSDPGIDDSIEVFRLRVNNKMDLIRIGGTLGIVREESNCPL